MTHPDLSSFDLQIKEKLEDATLPMAKRDWYEMAGKLYGAFDLEVEKSLSNYAVPYDPADWEAMVEHLDAAVYTRIREKLVHHEVLLQPADWKAMEAELDTWMPATPQPWYARWTHYAVGVTLSLLVLLGVAVLDLPKGIDPPAEGQGKAPVQVAPTSMEPNQPTEGADSMLQLMSDRAIPSANSLDGRTYTRGEALLLHHHLNLATDNLVPLYKFEPHAGLPGFMSPWEQGFGLLMVEEAAPTVSQFPIAEMHPKEAPEIEIQVARPEAIQIPDPKKGFTFDPELRVGLYAGSAVTRAELNDRGKLGGLGGIRVELMLNDHLSFTSGILYAEKQYNHTYYKFDIPDNAFGTTNRRHALDARFRLVEIPSLLKYQLPSNNHSLFVQAGVVTYISLEESYRHFDPQSANNSDKSQNSLLQQDPRNLDPTRYENRFSSYVGNIYASMGLDYPISPRMSMLIEPYFQMGLQSMGPENKKMYSGGVGMSVLYHLGKKKTEAQED